jgi:simple sugar transport system permease protein
VKDILAILSSVINIMTPLLLAATGGLFTDLSGTLNISLEGLLLSGAFAAAAAASFSGSLALGFLAALISALALSAVLALVTLNLKSNVFIAGLAVNLFAAGITVVLSQRFFGSRGVIVLETALSSAARIVIPLIALLILGAAWIVLYKTPFGFRLRSCDHHEQALRALGLKSDSYRFAGFLASGFCCGIGGAFLSLNLGAYVPNISSGKGWIALVVIYLGNRRPLGLLAAAFIFGLTDAFSNYAQGILNVPADFILALPYMFTLIVMIGVSVYTKRKHRVS